MSFSATGSSARSVTPHSQSSMPVEPVMSCSTRPAYVRPTRACPAISSLRCVERQLVPVRVDGAPLRHRVEATASASSAAGDAAVLAVVLDALAPRPRASTVELGSRTSPLPRARRARSSSSVAPYSDCSVSDTYEYTGSSGAASSSCWNAASRARSGPSAITPRSALWPSIATQSAWWPSASSDGTASTMRLPPPARARPARDRRGSTRCRTPQPTDGVTDSTTAQASRPPGSRTSSCRVRR